MTLLLVHVTALVLLLTTSKPLTSSFHHISQGTSNHCPQQASLLLLHYSYSLKLYAPVYVGLQY